MKYMVLSEVLAITFFHYGYLLPSIRSGALNRIAVLMQGSIVSWSRYSLSSIEELVSLIAAVLLQVPLIFLLMIVSGDELFRQTSISLTDVIGSIFLGIGEYGVASFLGFIVMRSLMVISPSKPRQDNYWIVLSRSGWMRLFSSGRRMLGFPLVALLVSMYVAVEECIFRGVIISSSLDFGAVAAFAVSVCAFVSYQFLNMPSRRSALFPAAGALVVGVINGIIVIETGLLSAAIIAHVIVFLIVSYAH